MNSNDRLSRKPRPRITVRQLLLTIAALAIVNAMGAGMDEPLGSGPGMAQEDGLGYFGTPQSARQQTQVAAHRVRVLRVVTILTGNVFVLTVLGFSVLARYLEEVRAYRSGEPSSHASEPSSPLPGRDQPTGNAFHPASEPS